MTSSMGMAQKKYAAIVLIFLLASGAGYLLTRVTGLNRDAVRAEIISHLSAWSGGPVEIYGPVRLSYFPSPRLTTGGLAVPRAPNVPYLKRLTATSLTLELGFSSLLKKKTEFARIVLQEPDIVLSPAPEDAGAATAAQVRRALRSVPIGNVTIRNGTAKLSGPSSNERFSKLNLQASIALPSGDMVASGDVRWRGEPISFSLRKTIAAPRAKLENRPFTLSLAGPMISADLEGKSTFADGLQAMGTLDLRIPDLRRLARWLGLLIPEDGPGLGRFSASGPFRWHGGRIGFDDGTFELDGNRALGTLGLELGGIRPKIDGTLAFTALDLKQYGGKPAEAGSALPGVKGKKKGAPPPVLLDFPLLHHLDMDLRLSTTQIQAEPLPLGQTALSILVKSGRLVADFAILDLCGGTGNGRVSFDATVADAEVRLTGNLSGVATKTCIEAFTPVSPVSTNAALSFDLSSRGRTPADLLSRISGKARVQADAGEIALDLAALAAREPGVSDNPWRVLHAGSTKFSEASTVLFFRKGNIYASDLRILSRPTRYSGDGNIDITGKKIDFRLSVGDAPKASPETSSQTPSAPEAAPTAVVLLKGPWSGPNLQVEKPKLEKPDQ